MQRLFAMPPRPLLGIPQKPRNISKNHGYPAIVHICPQMRGCYPHQCGQHCGKLGITPGGRADNRESRPRRVKRSLPQKVRRILAFWAPQNEVKIRAGVWRLQKWKTRVLARKTPENRRRARRMRGRGGRRVYGALGSRVQRSKAGGEETTRQVTLRSLTTFFLIASRYWDVGALPQTPQGAPPLDPARDFIP